MLCGEAGRRWFDKPSVIVFADGQAGINFEHSPCDGAQVLACFDAVRAHAAAAGAPPAAPPPDAARPIPLFWEIDGALQAQVDAAAAAYDAHVGRLDVAAFATADGGGMAWAKAHGVGLDALFQLALQLAYWRLVGRMDSVYEACSTQAFVHGRTEVVRSATAPSRALVEALGGGGAAPPAAEAGRLLREALAAHREVVRDCQAGRGHERHLLALSDVARRRGVELPIFGDGGWQRLSTSVISTSGLRSPHVASFVCGPVCAHGVGHSYLLRPDGVDLTVTSWRGTGRPPTRWRARSKPRSPSCRGWWRRRRRSRGVGCESFIYNVQRTYHLRHLRSLVTPHRPRPRRTRRRSNSRVLLALESSSRLPCPAEVLRKRHFFTHRSRRVHRRRWTSTACAKEEGEGIWRISPIEPVTAPMLRRLAFRAGEACLGYSAAGGIVASILRSTLPAEVHERLDECGALGQRLARLRRALEEQRTREALVCVLSGGAILLPIQPRAAS